jgi:putative selenate reductase
LKKPENHISINLANLAKNIIRPMLSDKFYPTPLPDLLQIILNQYDRSKSIFGIPGSLFFRPHDSDPFRLKRYGKLLETPIGVAAGPQTQLSKNIVVAWLTGARFIELKTIQTLDELEVSKPCIDMQDEGYNCEWSQELKVKQSFEQYLDAWILIHILKDKLAIGKPHEPGFIFNMSLGYNLEGILSENVQWFLDKMQDSSTELLEKLRALKPLYPRIDKLKISSKISDNVTISTMHGCPPEEIESIGTYMLEIRKLHTSIKLNPTLLGKEDLNKIMHNSGFKIKIPDLAFEHDPKYADALSFMSNLGEVANTNNLDFGIKLTNTLESINHKDVFSPAEKMMYMSGRALHPVSVSIAAKTQRDFAGRFSISFSGGANAWNIADLVACGLNPVTVCTDLLKPGGYGRLHQYMEELTKAFNREKADSIADFILKRAGDSGPDVFSASLSNLEKYAKEVLADSNYKKTGFLEPSIKMKRPLHWFDCIHAPCEGTCPTNQDIPFYNYYTSDGDFKKAAGVILQTNPFPRTTGMICDHLCQLKCTRINYEHAVLIREIKRFVAEEAIGDFRHDEKAKKHGAANKKVSIIGAGPSGLSCAYFLAKAGFSVHVYESKTHPGGMLASGIPSFRLTTYALENDIKLVEAFGVKLHHGQEADRELFDKLRRESDYIYIAAGAQRSAKLLIEGINANGVIDPLIFLEGLKEGNTPDIGENIVIIGGGNTAMDVARTAFRLIGKNGKVSILYRRTISEMPADMGEINAVINEGIEIIELVSPVKINQRNGRIYSITCLKMKQGPSDESGRPRPVIIPGSEFNIETDTIIPAVGQELAFDFGDANTISTNPGSYQTRIPGVFIGGDAMRGASTAINAIGDGRKVAQEILDIEKIAFSTKPENTRMPKDLSWHAEQRSKRMKPVQTRETPLDARKNFRLVSATISEAEARYEASRCLLCDEVCNICTTVCPNLAFHCYETEPLVTHLQKLVKKNGTWEIEKDKLFKVAQQYQILHIADWCNNCGNCNTFCPSLDAPYKIKPHLFLSEKAYKNEDEGFWFEINNGHNTLHRKINGQAFKLTEKNKYLIYEFKNNQILLDKTDLQILNHKIKETCIKEIDLHEAAGMFVILNGAVSFFTRKVSNAD